MKKIAELTMKLECGGGIKTFLPCKGEDDLLKKLRKISKGSWNDFGHFNVREDSILQSSYKLHEVN